MVSFSKSNLGTKVNKKKVPTTLDIALNPNEFRSVDSAQGKATTTQQPQATGQVYRNEAGRPSGIEVGGKTYLGLSPADVEQMAQAELNKKGGAATQEYERGVALQKQQIQQQQAGQEAVSGLGLSQEQIVAAQSGLQEAPVDIGQAAAAGTIRNAPSLITNIATGAAAGGTAGALIGGVGAIPGAVVGGVLGAIKGVWGGVQSNIAKQQKGQISASQDVLTAAKTNMRQLATLAAKDPANADQYVQAYNMQLAMVYRAQAQIKLETAGNLNKFVEDGTDILSDFDLFLMPNGLADIYRRKLELALVSGVPAEFSEEDLISEV